RSMNVQDLIAIDVHTHAEVSCRAPADDYGREFDEAASKYFKVGRRPTILETVAHYRERRVGFVMFPVDAEFGTGRTRVPNEEVAQAAAQNSDIMIAFASIDPHKGLMGAREARRLIAEFGVRGFKFHPTVQGFFPNDDVPVDFPDMSIVIAHPSWPWQDEALSVCLHKPNVYIDLSGWSPKYF